MRIWPLQTAEEQYGFLQLCTCVVRTQLDSKHHNSRHYLRYYDRPGVTPQSAA
jgi:hypothetical protein